MRITIIAFVAGLLFGGGLLLSGMTTPANITAFLDVAGDWNPALMVVMASAIIVAAPAFFIARRRQRTLWGEPAALDNRRPLDRRLLLGSAIFGVGWGLSGLCPGPSLVLLAGGSAGALVFVLAMSAGMVLAARMTAL